MLEHVLHIEQMTGVGAQVIINALLITYINEYALEYAGVAVGTHGHGYSALQHVLQQSHGLKTDGLTAGIGTRYKQYAVLCVQIYIKR